MNNWWADHRNLAAFCRHLVREEGYEIDEIVDVLEKPWHWSPEYKLFRAGVGIDPQDREPDEDRLLEERFGAW